MLPTTSLFIESKIEEAYQSLTGIDRGNLLIQKYFPAEDLRSLTMDEWIQQVAAARYLQDQEEITMANAIARALSPK